MTTFNESITGQNEYLAFPVSLIKRGFDRCVAAGEAAAIAAREDAAALKQTLQEMVDAMHLACTEADKRKWLSGTGKDYWVDMGMFLESMHLDGVIVGSSTKGNAKTSIKIAFLMGIPYQADLVNDYSAKTLEKKSEAQGQPTKAKPRKVNTYNAETRNNALCEALRQLRATGLTDLAADMLDMITGTIDGFAE